MNEIKSRAVGSDGISIQMIKALSPYAMIAITYLMNESLRKGKFPEAWKMSIVHPLPKVTAPTSVQQLRPISILPTMSKILEKIVDIQMGNYMERKNILPTLQSGFRSNHSTCTALVNLFAELYDARDKGMYSIIVLLDYTQAFNSMSIKIFLAKLRYYGFDEISINWMESYHIVLLDYTQAFDSMSIKMFLAKLRYYGFDEISINWMESYFDKRLQVTKHGGKTSKPLVRVRGVPQGSRWGLSVL